MVTDDVVGVLAGNEDLVVGEVVDDPLGAIRAATPARYDNLLYLPEVVLRDGPRTRVMAKICLIYEHETGAFHHARADLYYFGRQRNTGPFTLKNKAVLDEAALPQLLATISDIAPLQAMSIEQAEHVLLLPVGATPLPGTTMQRVAEGVSALLSSEQGWRALCEELLTADALDNLEAATQHARFKRATEELRALMDDPSHSEHIYQKWFEEHAWVFGTEYVRRIPTREIGLHSQADILLVSVDGFVDVFELKKPTEVMLRLDDSHSTYYPSAELSKTLGQVMHYLRLINEKRLELEEDWEEQVFRPRAIIVAGRSHDWSKGQHQAWRNLKTSLQNIDLLTFDHVLARAERLLRQYETTGAC